MKNQNPKNPSETSIKIVSAIIIVVPLLLLGFCIRSCYTTEAPKSNVNEKALLNAVKRYNPEVLDASQSHGILSLAIKNNYYLPESKECTVYADDACKLYKDYGIITVQIIDISSVVKAKSPFDWKIIGRCNCK